MTTMTSERKCGECKGTGVAEHSGGYARPCEACYGEGYISTPKPDAKGDAADDMTFTLDGPDGDGFVWLHRGNESINLGPWEQAAEAMSQWLGSIDFGERE